MRYYSDKTRKLYESEKELLEDEKKIEEKQLAEQKKKEELAKNRKARAKEVEEAFDAMVKANKNYRELLNNFCKEFGPFHYTWNSLNDDSVFDIFKWF